MDDLVPLNAMPDYPDGAGAISCSSSSTACPPDPVRSHPALCSAVQSRTKRVGDAPKWLGFRSTLPCTASPTGSWLRSWPASLAAGYKCASTAIAVSTTRRVSGGFQHSEILLAAGVQVRVEESRDLMHLKSYAIDGALLRTGSANWSPTGLKRQDNDLRYEVDPALVKLFQARFAEMWDRPNNLIPLPAGG